MKRERENGDGSTLGSWRANDRDGVVGYDLRNFAKSHRDDNGAPSRHPFGLSDKIRGRVVLMNDASNLSWTTLELNWW